MKNKFFFSIIAMLLTQLLFSQQDYYNVNSGNGKGLRFWNSDTYKIHMGNASEYKFGPVTDYSIKMNMSNTPGRGWTWGVAGQTPIAALNTLGDFQIAKSLRFSNGGGFYMTDTSWIRTYGNKNFYHNTGTMRTDGTFEVGPSGNRFRVLTNGKVGIGTSNPYEKLQVGNAIGLHDGGHKILTFMYAYSGGARDLDNTKHAGEIRFDPIAGNLQLGTSSALTNGPTPRMTIAKSGNVGIGTTNPDAKLAVNGRIHTKEVKVDLSGWADYVFKKEYKLPTLKEVAEHIQEKGHLINIPSEAEVLKNGIDLGQMNAKLLEKIEELTLYTIAQEKKIKEQENKNEELEARLLNLESALSKRNNKQSK